MVKLITLVPVPVPAALIVAVAVFASGHYDSLSQNEGIFLVQGFFCGVRTFFLEFCSSFHISANFVGVSVYFTIVP